MAGWVESYCTQGGKNSQTIWNREKPAGLFYCIFLIMCWLLGWSLCAADLFCSGLTPKSPSVCIQSTLCCRSRHPVPRSHAPKLHSQVSSVKMLIPRIGAEVASLVKEWAWMAGSYDSVRLTLPPGCRFVWGLEKSYLNVVNFQTSR